jgi:hypothetical protein
MDSRVALGSLLIFTFLGLLSVARRRCDGFVHREGTKDTKFGDWVSPTLRTTSIVIIANLAVRANNLTQNGSDSDIPGAKDAKVAK